MSDAATLYVSDLTRHEWTVVAERPEGPMGGERWTWNLAKPERDPFLMAQALGSVVMAHRHDGGGMVQLVARLARNGGAR